MNAWRGVLSKTTVLVLLAAAVTAGLTRAFVAKGFVVSGVSMEPTLLAGDYVLVSRSVSGGSFLGVPHRLWRRSRVQRFDLVVLRAEGGGRYAKRVLGLANDRIAMVAGRLIVNGQPLEEPYAAQSQSADRATFQMEWQIDYVAEHVDETQYFPSHQTWGPLVVPAGHFFVLGDNRDHSVDSRELGMIPVADVVGRVDRILLSHSGACCSPAAIWSGLRFARFGARPSGS